LVMGYSLRFYLDENLSPEIALLARSQQIDMTDCSAAGMRHGSDRDQLVFATGDGRCLITADKRDFTRIHAEFMRDGLNHAGIVILPRQLRRHEFPKFVSGLARISNTHPGGLTNLLLWFSDQDVQTS
jgi:Domain of unknown function (DUF5615)